MNPAPKTRRELRTFGWVMAGPFALLAGISFWKGGPAAPYLAGVAAFFLVSAGLAPGILRPVERYWMKLAHYLSIVSTFLILSVVFFAVLTPLNLVLRLLGKDLLHLKRSPTAASYWIATETDGPASRPDKPY
ncbi:MAG: SxtJ family membrane protein [Rhodothermales bacterium]